MGIKQILLSVVAMCGIVGAGAKPATEVVAHRGYWKAEGSAQNSVASLKKAIEIGARGSECDVYITTDGVVVVHHDPTIDGKRRKHIRGFERLQIIERRSNSDAGRASCDCA